MIIILNGKNTRKVKKDLTLFSGFCIIVVERVRKGLAQEPK